jgi:hypothetical protein
MAITLKANTVSNPPTVATPGETVRKPAGAANPALSTRTGSVSPVGSNRPRNAAPTAPLRVPTAQVLEALKRSSAVDAWLIDNGQAADRMDVRLLAEAIAQAGDCVVLRHHRKTYGKVGHISVMVVRSSDIGRCEIGIAHHESVTLASKPAVDDGAVTSSAGIRWNSYDTRALFQALDQPLEADRLPVMQSARRHGFPSSVIIPCSDAQAALACIEGETERSRKMLLARSLMRHAGGSPEPLDGLPPYAFGTAAKGPSGHAFYTPAMPDDSTSVRQAAMKDVASRQVNNCFEYAAVILKAAKAEGAGALTLGTSAGLRAFTFAHLVGGIAPAATLSQRLRGQGIDDLNSFKAFRWIGEHWGDMQPETRSWGIKSSRTPLAKL